MKFWKGLSIALILSIGAWAAVIYFSYQYGFRAGVESEQETISAAKLSISNGNQKLYQCNQIIMSNCGKQIAGGFQ